MNENKHSLNVTILPKDNLPKKTAVIRLSSFMDVFYALQEFFEENGIKDRCGVLNENGIKSICEDFIRKLLFSDAVRIEYTASGRLIVIEIKCRRAVRLICDIVKLDAHNDVTPYLIATRTPEMAVSQIKDYFEEEAYCFSSAFDIDYDALRDDIALGNDGTEPRVIHPSEGEPATYLVAAKIIEI